MLKEKLKHLPLNLLLNLPSLVILYFLINVLTTNNVVSFLISFYLYLMQVVNDSKIDYLEEKIKKLEDNNLIK